MKGIYDFGLESYAFQVTADDEKFVNELVTLCGKLSSVFGNKRKCKEIDKKISKLLTDRFGVNFRLNATDMDYAIMPTYITADTILGKMETEEVSDITDYIEANSIGDFSKNWAKNITKMDEFLSKNALVIDMEKARVVNMPKNITVDIFYNWKGGWLGPIDGRKMAAIFLHEVGHQMTWLEHLALTQYSNRVMTNFIKSKGKGSDIKKLTVKVASQMSDEEAKEYLEAVDTDNALIWTYENYSYFSSRASKLVDGRYDYNNSEQLADSFASKFGLQYELADALENMKNPSSRIKEVVKTSLIVFSITYFAIVSNFLLSLLFTGALFTTAGLKAVLTVSVTVAPIIVVTSLVLSHVVGIDSGNMTTYDNTVNRVKRLKREIIMMLKNADLSKDKQKEIIGKLDMMDEWIRAAKLDYGNIYTYFANAISPTNWRFTKDTDFNQFIEDLANNSLTARHMELSELAS